MTCASCASRIERRLNKLDGVTASVNYATERASVDFDAATVAPEDLLAAVESAGYHAVLPASPDAPRATAPDPAAAQLADLRRRLIVSAALARAAAAGVAALVVESDPNALPFYLARGAVRIAERASPSTGRALPLLRLSTG